MKTKIIHFLGIASLFLCILSMAIVITINFTPLYAVDIDHLALAEKLGLSKETLMTNYHILMDYLNKPWITELKLPNFPSSENGLFHFYEVKRLFMLDYMIALVTLIGSVVYVRFVKRTYTSWKLIRPFQIGMVVPFVVLFMIALNFDQLFIGFHEIFFNNDAWMFNPSTDPIILALPETFFMHCFVLAFVLIELAIISGYFIAKRTAFKKN